MSSSGNQRAGEKSVQWDQAGHRKLPATSFHTLVFLCWILSFLDFQLYLLLELLSWWCLPLSYLGRAGIFRWLCLRSCSGSSSPVLPACVAKVMSKAIFSIAYSRTGSWNRGFVSFSEECPNNLRPLLLQRPGKAWKLFEIWLCLQTWADLAYKGTEAVSIVTSLVCPAVCMPYPLCLPSHDIGDCPATTLGAYSTQTLRAWQVSFLWWAVVVPHDAHTNMWLTNSLDGDTGSAKTSENETAKGVGEGTRLE